MSTGTLTADTLTRALEGRDEGPAIIPRDAAHGTITRTGQTFAFVYMGGPLAIALAAVRAGAIPGDELTVRYWRFTPDTYRVTPTGGGDRTPGGVWVVPA